MALLAPGARGDAPWSFVAREAVDRTLDWPPPRARPMPASPARDAPPLTTGWVGYLGYGAKLSAPAAHTAADPLGMPSCQWSRYDALYAFHEPSQRGLIIHETHRGAETRARRILAALEAPHAPRAGAAAQLRCPTRPAEFQGMVRALLDEIAAGNVYQANLSHSMEGVLTGSPEACLARLLAAPPPYSAFLALPEGGYVLSASPECFVAYRARDRRLQSFPIKGTCPRDADPKRDRALGAALQADPKERAEHHMIVDLIRNDLGRIAELGSVTVPRLAALLRFSRVQHLESEIQATLAPQHCFTDALPLIFPGGSITGAPKRTAMACIAALEPHPRGLYTGAIGYLSDTGDARFSIAIRTAQIAPCGALRLGVGAGIVADSDPRREWRETQLKARFMAGVLDAAVPAPRHRHTPKTRASAQLKAKTDASASAESGRRPAP